jgi:uncharacterized metal-binding protein YceD (DUF177 family)
LIAVKTDRVDNAKSPIIGEIIISNSACTTKNGIVKSSINIVSEETGVEKKVIIEFIKNDRLIAEDLEIDVTIKCQRCGTEIKHGKYCDSCVTKMKDEIESLTKKDKKEIKKRNSEHNMHVADRSDNN